MISPRSAFDAANRYLKSHPEEWSRIIRGFMGLRIGVPMAVFRWLASEALDANTFQEVEIESVEPGLRLKATFVLMGTRVRAGATVFIDNIDVRAEHMLVFLRLEDVTMITVDEGSRTHISALLNSGSLDLSRPGDLIANLPDMPNLFVKAFENRITIDMLAIEHIRNQGAIRHALGLISSWITIDGVATNQDHLDFHFRPLPRGFTDAYDAVADHLLSPSISQVRRIFPTPWRNSVESQARKVFTKIGYHESEPARKPGPGK